MIKKYWLHFLIVSVLLLAHLVILAQIATIGYRNDASRKELNEIRSKNRKLSAIASGQESLRRIDNIARNEMKMVVPERIVYIDK